LANQSYAVATLDCRRMGLSAPPLLRGFNMIIGDWAQGDCVVMINALKA